MTLDLAGEASPDSRALIAEYLASDPDLAVQVEAARGLQLRLPPPRPLPLETGRQALVETRALLKQRTSTFATAPLFTLLPLSFVFEGGGIRFFVLESHPAIAVAWWATVAVMWFAHLRLRHRLRVSGL